MSRLPKQEEFTINPRLKALSAVDFVLFGRKEAANAALCLLITDCIV